MQHFADARKSRYQLAVAEKKGAPIVAGGGHAGHAGSSGCWLLACLQRRVRRSFLGGAVGRRSHSRSDMEWEWFASDLRLRATFGSY